MSPNGIITHYLFNYSIEGNELTGEESSMRIDAEDGQLSYEVVLTNLTEFTRYVIQVSAFTRIGEGEASRRIVVTDPDLASPPQSLEAVAINSTSVRLSWEYPLFPRGEIGGYVISYNNETDMINVTLENADNMSNQSFTVGMLLPYTEYTFQVAAYAIHEGVAIVGATDEETVRTLEAGKN